MSKNKLNYLGKKSSLPKNPQKCFLDHIPNNNKKKSKVKNMGMEVRNSLVILGIDHNDFSFKEIEIKYRKFYTPTHFFCIIYFKCR